MRDNCICIMSGVCLSAPLLLLFFGFLIFYFLFLTLPFILSFLCSSFAVLSFFPLHLVAFLITVTFLSTVLFTFLSFYSSPVNPFPTRFNLRAISCFASSACPSSDFPPTDKLLINVCIKRFHHALVQ